MSNRAYRGRCHNYKLQVYHIYSRDSPAGKKQL